MFSWEVRGIALTNIQAIIFLVTVCCLALLQFIVYRTRMGKAMRAVSHDHVTAGLMGVNVDLVISFTFGLGAALAGIGGVLYGIAYPQVNTFMGVMPGLKAFTAAVLGGIGSIPAVLGALIMGRRKPDRGIPLLDITGRYRHHPGAVLLLRPGILSVPGTEKGLNAWKISDRQGSSVPGRGGGGRAAAGIVRACQSILGPDVQLGCIMSISALGLNVITGLPVCSPWGTRHSTDRGYTAAYLRNPSARIAYCLSCGAAGRQGLLRHGRLSRGLPVLRSPRLSGHAHDGVRIIMVIFDNADAFFPSRGAKGMTDMKDDDGRVDDRCLGSSWSSCGT